LQHRDWHAVIKFKSLSWRAQCPSPGARAGESGVTVRRRVTVNVTVTVPST
jgi:hypothetical protein